MKKAIIIKELAETLDENQCQLLSELFELNWGFLDKTNVQRIPFFEELAKLQTYQNWTLENCKYCPDVKALQRDIESIKKRVHCALDEY